MFEIDDKVWDMILGDGIVTRVKFVDNGDRFITVDFADAGLSSSYTSDGRRDPTDVTRRLYFQRFDIVAPPQALRKTNLSKRASYGKHYYYINYTGAVSTRREENSEWDDEMSNIGNYFLTLDLAFSSDLCKVFKRMKGE